METSTPIKRKRPHGYRQLKAFMDSHKDHLHEIRYFDDFFESYQMDVAFWSLSLKDIYSYKQLFNAWKCLYLEIWMQEFHGYDPVLSSTVEYVFLFFFLYSYIHASCKVQCYRN